MNQAESRKTSGSQSGREYSMVTQPRNPSGITTVVLVRAGMHPSEVTMSNIDGHQLGMRVRPPNARDQLRGETGAHLAPDLSRRCGAEPRQQGACPADPSAASRC